MESIRLLEAANIGIEKRLELEGIHLWAWVHNNIVADLVYNFGFVDESRQKMVITSNYPDSVYFVSSVSV